MFHYLNEWFHHSLENIAADGRKVEIFLSGVQLRMVICICGCKSEREKPWYSLKLYSFLLTFFLPPLQWGGSYTLEVSLYFTSFSSQAHSCHFIAFCKVHLYTPGNLKWIMLWKSAGVRNTSETVQVPPHASQHARCVSHSEKHSRGKNSPLIDTSFFLLTLQQANTAVPHVNLFKLHPFTQGKMVTSPV